MSLHSFWKSRSGAKELQNYAIFQNPKFALMYHFQKSRHFHHKFKVLYKMRFHYVTSKVPTVLRSLFVPWCSFFAPKSIFLPEFHKKCAVWLRICRMILIRVRWKASILAHWTMSQTCSSDHLSLKPTSSLMKWPSCHTVGYFCGHFCMLISNYVVIRSLQKWSDRLRNGRINKFDPSLNAPESGFSSALRINIRRQNARAYRTFFVKIRQNVFTRCESKNFIIDNVKNAQISFEKSAFWTLNFELISSEYQIQRVFLKLNLF